MSSGENKGDKAQVLGARANGRTFLPSFAPNATSDATSKTNGVPDKENNPTAMASGAHSRKHSASSLSDARSTSPEASRIPRPSSRASPQTRRPFTINEATDWAKSRLAQGSPSPAPRPTRPVSVNSDHKPLPQLFTQRPIDLGRLGNRRPVAAARRDGTFSSKGSFGSSSRKGDESDSEIDRKLRQFEEDEKIIKSMKEDKKGLFIKPKFGVNGAGPNTKSGHTTSNGSFGDGGADGKESRQSWAFAETGYANPDWITRFESEEQALDFAPGRQSRIEGFSSFGTRVAGSKRKSESQSLPGPGESASAIPRPATVAPIQSPNKSYAWQVDEDFTAGDLQVSNSPPVSFARANTKLDEIRKLEIDAELDHPIENHRFVPQRTNTKLEEISQREKDAERRYPVPRIEEPSAEPVDELSTSAGTRRPTSTPNLANSGSGSYRSLGVEYPPERVQLPTGLKETIEPQISRSTSPRAGHRDGVGRSHQTSPRVSPESKTQPRKADYTGLDGEKIPNTPVTIYRNKSPTLLTNEQNGLNPSTASTSVYPATGASRAKEDSHDLLRRLARASSNSPVASPAEDGGPDKAAEEDRGSLSNPKGAEPVVGGVDTTDKKTESDLRFSSSLGMNKPNALAKPTVGFAGISRSPSTKSVSSTQSRASADPTARIEGEMKLFAPMDNMSERGSVRAPSPRPDIDSESDDDGGKADETPRAPKFDPLSMPTPQVTGAYVETPVTVKTEQVQIKVEDPAASIREPEEKARLQNRDTSTSPRSSKSDGQRVQARSNSISKWRRSRSTPRKQSALRNSARVPSAKEDLKQINLENNIDESTTDDFDDFVLASRPPDSDSEDDVLTHDRELTRIIHMGKALNTGLASIRQAKKGIGRLEDRVAHSEQAPGSIKNDTTAHNAIDWHKHEAQSPSCIQCAATQQSNSLLAHVLLPVPVLWRTQPKFRLTWLGTLLLLLASWYALENVFYERWGRQYVCYRGSPCNWSPEQPDYGYVFPVKLDEWLTGGMVRPHAAHWLLEASDLYADFEDWWTGTDLRDVSSGAISDPAKREQYFRRIDKKGLRPQWKPPPAYRAMFEALERESLAEEEAEARGESPYGRTGSIVDERMGKDDVLPKTSEDEEPPRTIWF